MRGGQKKPCPVAGCGCEIRLCYAMCGRHWRMLSRPLQDEHNRTYAAFRAVSDDPACTTTERVKAAMALRGSIARMTAIVDAALKRDAGIPTTTAA